MRITCAISLVLGLAASACSKKAECGPSAYHNEEQGFCIALPTGYQAGKPQGSSPTMMSVHPAADILGYTVYWNEQGTLKERGERVSGMTAGGLKLEGSGEIPNGKWWRFRTQNNTTFAVVLVEGKKGLIRCELQNRPDADADTELESCKSLRAS